ncbi:MAG: hypothetical protein KC940_16295, partial [Candidatus Omnitrophica bacterium]|nr:hypothetical protein [Candidatus Omnitrophota bacterium]
MPSLRLGLLVFLLIFTIPPGWCQPSFNADDMGVYIRDWLVCGPFPNQSPRVGSVSLEDYRSEGFDKDFLAPLGGESNVDPIVGDSFTDPSTGRTYEWKELQSEDDLISFENYFEENDHVDAYAFTHIGSPDEKRLILSVGSNDGIRVFLNGELVHSHLILRWLGKDTDYVPVTLRKGTNRLLIKVDESGGDWGFSARFLDNEETIQSIRGNIETHSKLRVVTRGDHLAVFFG